MAWTKLGTVADWKRIAPADGALSVGPAPLWMIGEDGEHMAVVQIQGTSGAKANVTPDGKLSVDAQVTATVADSKIKGSTDAGTTWLPVKVDGSGQLLVSVPGGVALSGSNIIVAIEDTATSLVTQAVFQVRQIVAVHNDGSDNLFVSFNGNTWLRIPAGKSALENALLSATTLYYKANSPVPFRAWGVM